ncbi:MAG: tRNA-dihydrouridine synthase family protein [Muribaculaceae bacterium]|jgi:tRNA-dihydrouridine synthase|nr:tRNA-dihydrouridine synthase family protein [Muribaculaceae bacterium]
MSDFKIFAAPLQGYTEAAWRGFHARLTGCIDEYFTPFLRIEKGEMRRRDLRDLTSQLNEGAKITPQIIFGSIDEFRQLTSTLSQLGFDRIDINMGCPFPPQVHHGRGAGMITRTELLKTLSEELSQMPDISFSIKMRLGATADNEWRQAMPIINRMPLRHVTLHPRIASQQYRGTLNYSEAASFAAECAHPLIFNGEIHSTADIATVVERFQSIKGVMLGRGLLARPTLAAEYRSDKETSDEEIRACIVDLHEAIYKATAPSLCGDSQILAKMKPFWEYAGTTFDRKAMKAVAKAHTTSAYLEAVRKLSCF